MTIILWDIDGTLVRSNGGRVAVNAFLRALCSASNLPHELLYPTDAGGKTDTQLLREVLAAAAVTETETVAIGELFAETYLAELLRDREYLISDLCVLPGVLEVLQRLEGLGAMQSLLTGNLEPIARLKLGCVQLDRYLRFELGAYGSDHHDRTCLVPIALERARQQLGYHPTPGEVVLVGDTPRDIACARAGGAHVVAVATGRYTRQDLEAHAPDALFDDLSDVETVVETLLRYSTNSEHQQALIV